MCILLAAAALFFLLGGSLVDGIYKEFKWKGFVSANDTAPYEYVEKIPEGLERRGSFHNNHVKFEILKRKAEMLVIKTPLPIQSVNGTSSKKKATERRNVQRLSYHKELKERYRQTFGTDSL